MYINNKGFISMNKKLSLSRLTGSYTITQDLSSGDTTITIPISSYVSTDILNIYYEGAVLTKDVHYSLNTSNKTITLLSFPTNVGDIVQFDLLRLS
jgi:hypothetical protein